MRKKVRLLIIDDHQLFAESIASLLTARGEIETVRTMTANFNTFREVEAALFDMILLNSNSIPANATHLIRKWKSGNNNLKVIVYRGNAEDATMTDLIEAGANGYVLKNASFDELLAAIKNVQEGVHVRETKRAAVVSGKPVHFSREGVAPEKRGSALLTPRETRILELIALGLGNKDIALRLDISLYTVKNHVHNILEKLQVHFRRDAIRYAYFYGLVKNHPAPSQIEARSQPAPKAAKTRA